MCDQRVWADYCNELFQVGNKIKKIEGELYRDRETRIRAIEKTFGQIRFAFLGFLSLCKSFLTFCFLDSSAFVQSFFMMMIVETQR